MQYKGNPEGIRNGCKVIANHASIQVMSLNLFRLMRQIISPLEKSLSSSTKLGRRTTGKEKGERPLEHIKEREYLGVIVFITSAQDFFPQFFKDERVH